MSAISEAIEEAGAQGRQESLDTGQGGSGAEPVDLPERLDPFIQEYVTDEYELDTQTINQVLTGVIAVANIA